MVEPAVQARFEKNLIWERSWPKWLLGLLATLEILLTLAILLTEFLNILTDFWHSNVFGGIWASIVLLINWMLIYVTVCCATTTAASTCSFVWNLITLIAFGVLIAFDIIFIITPSTCILTPTCGNQSQITSLNSAIQTIPQFSNYTIYDSKRLFLEIQVGCAGGVFLISIIMVIIFLVCRLKLRKHAVQNHQTPVFTPRRHGLRVAQAPPMYYPQLPNAYPYASY